MRLAKKYIPEPIRHVINHYFSKISRRRQLLYKFPWQMSIEITNKCNLKCCFCPRPKLKNLKVRDIDFELFKKFVEDVAEMQNNRTVIYPVGLGEPLMYDKLADAIKYIKMKCPNTPIEFNSNATVLDEKKSEMLCKLLNNKDRFIFSINAWTKEKYKQMMGVDAFDLVVSNINNFLSIRKKIGRGPKVIFQLMETKDNVSETEEFKNYWKSRMDQKDGIWIRPITNWGGQIDTKDMIVKEKGKRYPCIGLWAGPIVDFEGNVYACCEAISRRRKSDLLIGNIYEKSLKEIYSGNKIEEFRKKHLNSRWEDIPECSKCDGWSFNPNIWFKIGKKWV